jgi:dTDP-4-dehydrorhamnose 3,5-epimerase
MKIEPLKLHGALMIKADISQDSRGNFFKLYSAEYQFANDNHMDAKEVFYSTSGLDVIRGMHFQVPPSEQGKLVNVIRGRITDVLLDIRTDSESYGEYIAIELIENDSTSIYIPKGIAHGFASREEGTIVLYVVDSAYSSVDESGIKYDSFGYEWKVENPILSSRDMAFKKFNQFDSPFRHG